MADGTKGVLAMVGACIIWGLSGIYYKALAHVPPLEVLAHRTLWSVVFFGTVLLLQGRGRQVRDALATGRTLAVLAASAVIIALNWLGFIYAIQSGQALEASLGYYIFPLVAVALGFFVFGERFSRLQAVAIGLAALAVGFLTLGLGTPPWIALLLAASFGGYGLLKKGLALGPVISVFIETLLLAPVALIWLWGVHRSGWSDLGGRVGGIFLEDIGTALLLMGSGPLTAAPLILFSFAARRVSYATVGLVQYLNPTLQFAIAVLIFGEVFSLWHAVAFPMIWIGLALYSVESWRQEKRSRRQLITPSTLS
jgi:chloramphenicol-sensitive protein RarD